MEENHPPVKKSLPTPLKKTLPPNPNPKKVPYKTKLPPLPKNQSSISPRDKNDSPHKTDSPHKIDSPQKLDSPHKIDPPKSPHKTDPPKSESPRNLDSPKKKTITSNMYASFKKAPNETNQPKIVLKKKEDDPVELSELKLADSEEHIDPERPNRNVPKLPEKSKKLQEKFDTKKCSKCSTIFRGKSSNCPKCSGSNNEMLTSISEKDLSIKMLSLVETEKSRSHFDEDGFVTVQTLRTARSHKTRTATNLPKTTNKTYQQKWESIVKKKEIRERVKNLCFLFFFFYFIFFYFFFSLIFFF